LGDSRSLCGEQNRRAIAQPGINPNRPLVAGGQKETGAAWLPRFGFKIF
jgi:hypothetical protein